MVMLRLLRGVLGAVTMLFLLVGCTTSTPTYQKTSASIAYSTGYLGNGNYYLGRPYYNRYPGYYYRQRYYRPDYFRAGIADPYSAAWYR